MQSRKLWPNGVLDYAVIGRSSFVSAALFGLAAVLLATQATSQTRSDPRFGRPATTGGRGRDPDAPSFQAGASLSAPVPTVEEADLRLSLADFALSAGGRSGPRTRVHLKARRRVCQRPRHLQRPKSSLSIMGWAWRWQSSEPRRWPWALPPMRLAEPISAPTRNPAAARKPGTPGWS